MHNNNNQSNTPAKKNKQGEKNSYEMIRQRTKEQQLYKQNNNKKIGAHFFTSEAHKII